jgi:hypothetical protein
MAHYQFFEEYRDEGLRTRTGNVIAVHISEGPFVQDGAVCFKAVRAAPESRTANDEVIMALLNAEYLGTHCRQLEAVAARVIHPRLFDFIERLA